MDCEILKLRRAPAAGPMACLDPDMLQGFQSALSNAKHVLVSTGDCPNQTGFQSEPLIEFRHWISCLAQAQALLPSRGYQHSVGQEACGNATM